MAQNAGERAPRGAPRIVEAGAPRAAEPRRAAPDRDGGAGHAKRNGEGHGEGRGRAEPHGAQADGAGSAPALGRNPEAEETALPPHEPGSMDISQHEETYQAFIRLTIRAVITIFVVLILLALING